MRVVAMKAATRWIGCVALGVVTLRVEVAIISDVTGADVIITGEVIIGGATLRYVTIKAEVKCHQGRDPYECDHHGCDPPG